MRSDYIVPEAPKPHAARPGPWIGLTLLCVAVGLFLMRDIPATSPITAPEHNSAQSVASKSSNSFLADLSPISHAEAKSAAPLTPMPEAKADLSAAMTIPAQSISATDLATSYTPVTKTTRSKSITVKSGDSLSILFDRHNLRAADWMALAKLKGDARRLSRLHPGDTLELELNSDDSVAELQVRLNDLSTLSVARLENGSFEQTVLRDTVETREVSVTGVIHNSLFLSAKSAGLSDRLTMELTDVFAWDVDFAMDIRVGDSFRVVYEEIYRDGEKLKDGDILAAEFINRGNTIKAVRYTDENGRDGFYSPDGEPMQKAFLRSPLDFTRISSRFSLGRKHPILNKIRAHKGVDYAAPRGTPIKSAGTGKVIFAGRKGGYGNVLIVQHAGKYTTLYAHLQNYRRGIRRGSSVSQGQVIAYVGSSGLATGPHLHYEFRVDGRHVNPLTVKLPSSPKIAAAEIERFKNQTAPLLAKLETNIEPEQTATEVAAAN